MWLNKMSLATRTTTIKKGKECSEEKKKKKEGKKVTWEWLVAFAAYYLKIRELTSHESKKKNFKQNTYKTPHLKRCGVTCQLSKKWKQWGTAEHKIRSCGEKN